MTIIKQFEGLFHRAIFMSGTSFNRAWCLVPRSYCGKFAEALARKLGWNGKKGDEKSILEYLEEVPAYDIVTETLTVAGPDDWLQEGVNLPFVPCIEAYDSENCLIDKDPILMARDAWSKNIDVIFSACGWEGIVVASLKEESAEKFLKTSPACLSPLCELDLTPGDPMAIEYGERLKN